MTAFPNSWEFEGDKTWDNVFDHWFIRSALQPGWSAGQGGPAASSHTRELDTQTYLQRPCVMNPQGGPQQVGQADIHNLRAELSLAEVDLVRRKYYNKLKERAEIDEKLSMMQKSTDIKRNWGWPFTVGVAPKPMEEEEIEGKKPLFPPPELPDFEKPWKQEPFGRIMWKEKKKEEDGEKKDERGKKGEEEDDHFTPFWEGAPLGWQEGYLKWFDKKLDPNDESQTTVLHEAGYYWTGPEKNPAILDQLFWKPIARSGPIMVESLGAKKTVEAIALGRELETHVDLQKKRSYGHKVKFKDLSKGGYKEVDMGDGRFVDTNISVKDPFTGIPIYTYSSKQSTVTDAKGHGTLDQGVLCERKKIKLGLLEKQVEEFEDELDDLQHEIQKTEEKYHMPKPKITHGIAREKIIAARAKMDKINKKKEEYEIRINREKREIKAIETRMDLDNVGKGLPLPKELMYAIPAPVLENMRGAAKSLGIVRDLPVDEEIYESSSGESDDDESNFIMQFFKGKDKQARKGMKNEKYFGKPLIDPATGKLDEKVVRRKNVDTVARYQEINKSIADVYLSRSDGTSKYNKTNNVAPKLREQERKAREEQQEQVKNLVSMAIDNDNHLELQQWASSEVRKDCTFGSSKHQVPKAVLCTIQTGDGEYLKMRTFNPPPQVIPGMPVPPPSAVPAKCSSGKVVGGGKFHAKYELLGWGPEEDDVAMSGGSTSQWYPQRSAQNCVTANTLFGGRRANPGDKEKGPFAPSVILEREWNGVKPGEEKGRMMQMRRKKGQES